MEMRWTRYALVAVLIAGILGGCGKEEVTSQEITLYAAKSLNRACEELIDLYQQSHPQVTIKGSYDSSGTLMEGILNGHVVDVFFSASKTQMNRLKEEGLIAEGSEIDLLNNRVCVVTYQGSDTRVTGLESLGAASSLALADGSVPVGRYTRKALVEAGILEARENVADITAWEISKALGGLTINECANVGAVVTAVAEGSNEIGTVYYSDIYGREDKLSILQEVPYELTGNVIYPVARVVNSRLEPKEIEAVEEFLTFLQSREAKEIFIKYHFDVIDQPSDRENLKFSSTLRDKALRNED